MSTALGIAYGAFYGTSSTVANALCLILDPPTPEAGSLQVTTAMVGAPGESVGMALDGAAWPALTTLSAALSTSVAITSLPVVALAAAITAGSLVYIANSPTTSQLWTVSSTAAIGATSIPVTSQTPNFAYPSGTNVGPTTVLDTWGQGLYTGVLPNLTSGSHTLSGLGTNSGQYDLSFPVKFNPHSTASDLTPIVAPSTVPQIKWRLYDPRVSTYTQNQVPRVNLAPRPRCDSWGTASSQEWAFMAAYAYGTYSLLSGITGPIGIQTAVRKTVTTSNTSAFNIELTSTNPDNATATAALSPIITPGATYTISFYANATRGDSATQTPNGVYAFYDISGALIGSKVTVPGTALPVGTWTRQSFTIAAPKNAAMFGFYLQGAPTTAPAVNDTIDISGLLIEQAQTLGTYFDGNSTAADTVYYWAGNPADSVSVASPGFYQFAYNPPKWTSPLPQKNITHVATPPIGGQVLAWEAGQKPTTFTFTGMTHSQGEYQNMQAWAAKNSRFWLVDHRNVARLVMFTQLDIAPRNSPTNPWESDYTVSVTQYTANDGWN